MTLVLAALVVVATAQASFGATDNCPEEVAKKNREKFERQQQQSNDVAEEMIKGLPRDEIEECLGGIILNDSFSLGISFPSLMDICRQIRAATQEALAQQQAQLKIEPLPGFEVGAGGAVSHGDKSGVSSGIRVDTRSDTKTREILEKITREH
jgi:translation elongation factor EF-Ts